MAEIIRKEGFTPIYFADSELLILGSFPSVKSRQIDFYYGNKQNRFWKTVCAFFGEEIPEEKDGKIEFLRRRKIALWDMVTACEIEGSADASIKNAETADLSLVLKNAPIKKILLNGTLAYDLFVKSYADLSVPHVKMPSTSPANPRFDPQTWRNELNDVFRFYP